MAIDLDKYLNYVVPKPTYLGQLEQAGLITAQDLESAKKQSAVQGLLGAGLSYLAQPKTGGYGSAVPYLAKSAMVGLESAGAPYKRLAENAMTGAKIQDIAYERGKRESVQKSVEDFIAENPQFSDMRGLTIEQQGSIMSDFYKQKNKRRLGVGRYQKQYLVKDNNTNETYNAVYDTYEGKTFVNTPDGRVAYDDFVKDRNTSIFTAGGAQKGVMTPSGFSKTREELVQDEIGLDNLVKYMKGMEDLPSGYNKLANQFTEWWKTFVDANKDEYTEQELAQRVAEGRFQGLIGLVRIETVGGGVMTEFDAQRIVNRLGGDPRNISTNPEVIRQQIQDVMKNKYRRYQNNLEEHNIAVQSGPYSQYKPKKPITFSDDDLKMFDPEFLQEVPLQNIPTFASEQEAEAAFNQGLIKSGDKIRIGNQTGKWE